MGRKTVVSPAPHDAPGQRAEVEPREVDHLFGSGIIVAVGAVVRNDSGEVLLVRHVPDRRGYWRGRWICPGGRLTRGESILSGAIREVLEETGLAIRPVRQLQPFERIVTVDAVTRLHVIYIDYLADVVGGTLTPASDIGEAIWVREDDLGGIWADCHEDTQRLLRLAGFQPT
ncbi:MAG TPA: NUDIX domain-containing protein [Dehalococcoidia bacterium]|nr:NUDIX domain-containing protein [Dehalococcoidia bacterium]